MNGKRNNRPQWKVYHNLGQAGVRVTEINGPESVCDLRGFQSAEPAEPMEQMTDEEYDEFFREAAKESARKAAELCADLHRRGFRTITDRPEKFPVMLWLDKFTDPLGSDSEMKARSITLTLAGDGCQVQVRAETQVTRYILLDARQEWVELIDTIHLVVIADEGVFTARIHEVGYDMLATVIAFRGNPSDALMAAVLEAVRVPVNRDWPLPLYARLADLGKCHACNRPLTDPVSRVLGIGPGCAHTLGLEHSIRVADAVFKQRQGGAA
ncbi:DUF6011 domain-containing protein [Ectothiorhodospira lacustris]|uniref:DUF6011 domain-containing protein n=1 Tax=Ectothiorhodospira lacustris TaxID=2899127 RepID=UPI001EE85E53|nr:DUF6011 domain-containing protein [Ectothiorhodospira lacustris]MCG5509624.1 DUF6011 domain-containing protein [Ectothiorhodospira lacustris]MCG5521581.1 DUF6011 domain-containing protein [Ectothiorhodospira lacustris]